MLIFSSTHFSLPAFPLDPIIENPGPFLEDGEATLYCSVADVYPASHVQIQWLDGETELHSGVGRYSSELQNVTSTLSFSVEPEDQGRRITCRVGLQMDVVHQSRRERKAVTVLELHCKWLYRLLKSSSNHELLMPLAIGWIRFLMVLESRRVVQAFVPPQHHNTPDPLIVF